MPSDDGVDPRPLWAGFPTGVAVITAVDGSARPWGMTCTSLCSVSLDPPILLVCLRDGSPTLDAVRASGRFALNLLHDQAQPTAELFASGLRERFSHVAWRHEGHAAGPHLPSSAHTIADCALTEAHDVGDHAVILGRVYALSRVSAQRPLLYGLRRYATWHETAIHDPAHQDFDFIS